MEVSTLEKPIQSLPQAAPVPLRGSTPLLRLQSDERLVAMVRNGNQGAFETLVSRYQSRLLAFTRHMLSSKEDAEDILQETFTAAFNAMLADNRPINVRPWLYRIARNRSLNHLRRAKAVGVDSMDTHFADAGASTDDKVEGREKIRQLLGDVKELPETQRTALLLREIDALSYDQIAEAMDTTVPSVKSLLVRARVGLAESAEARRITCEQVREELGQVAEGLTKITPPVRRHLKFCESCDGFRADLKQNNRSLAAVLPVGFLLLIKKLFWANLGTTANASAATAASTGSSLVGSTAASAGSGIISASVSTVTTKAAAGLATAALVTAGAVEVNNAATERVSTDAPSVTRLAEVPAATTAAQPATTERVRRTVSTDVPAEVPDAKPVPTAAAPVEAAPVSVPGESTPTAPAADRTENLSDTTTLPESGSRGDTVTQPETPSTTVPATPPGESPITPTEPVPAPTTGATPAAPTTPPAAGEITPATPEPAATPTPQPTPGS
mgnify:CR=1 FL=1